MRHWLHSYLATQGPTIPMLEVESEVVEIEPKEAAK